MCRSLVGFLSFSSTSISRNIFTFFACQKVSYGDTNGSFITAVPSISCNSDTYHGLLLPNFIVAGTKMREGRRRGTGGRGEEE